MKKLILISLFILYNITACTPLAAPSFSKDYSAGAIFRLKKDTSVLVVCKGDNFTTTTAIRVQSLKTGEYYLIKTKELIK